jgi:hypothetical protein
MKKTFIFCLGMFFSTAVLAAEQDVRCLSSIDSERTIKLQFAFPDSKEDLALVTFQNGRGALPVRLKKEKTVEEAHPGRPSVFQTEWQERAANGMGGIYKIMTQGARIIEFRYIRQDGKTFDFDVDLEASSENRCRWAVK